MPLLDHFHPPLDGEAPWETVRERWLHTIIEGLSRVLPVGDFRAYYACNNDEFDPDAAKPVIVGSTTDMIPPVGTIEWHRPDATAVHVLDTRPFGRLAGVVEVVTEEVKRSERERRIFAAKCMIHMREGANVVIVDAITNQPFNLHNELMDYCGVRSPKGLLPEHKCYVAAYRYHTDVHRMDSWHRSVAVGEPIPSMPLCIATDLFVPIDLEATYTAALADHNL